MRHLGFVALVLLSAPLTAHADTTGTMAAGLAAGAHEAPDDTGATIGAHLDGDVRFGIVAVGGSAGIDSWAAMSGAPVHAGTLAAHAGVAVPFITTPKGSPHNVVFRALGALEGGVHYYSPEGEQKDFLGPTTTYEGETRARMFVGLRTGAEMAITRHGSNGVVLRLEVIGRRDTHSAQLEYTKISCGGLFNADNDCSGPDAGMVEVGGTELAVTTSIGVQFGGS